MQAAVAGLLASVAAATAVQHTLQPGGRYTSIRPGQQWLDTDGQLIRAHSGGLLVDPKQSNKTYWYGSDGCESCRQPRTVATPPSRDFGFYTDCCHAAAQTRVGLPR